MTVDTGVEISTLSFYWNVAHQCLTASSNDFTGYMLLLQGEQTYLDQGKTTYP